MWVNVRIGELFRRASKRLHSRLQTAALLVYNLLHVSSFAREVAGVDRS
jgi:hypothetical protein